MKKQIHEGQLSDLPAVIKPVSSKADSLPGLPSSKSTTLFSFRMISGWGMEPTCRSIPASVAKGLSSVALPWVRKDLPRAGCKWGGSEKAPAENFGPHSCPHPYPPQWTSSDQPEHSPRPGALAHLVLILAPSPSPLPCKALCVMGFPFQLNFKIC